MNLVSIPLMMVVLAVGATTIAVAAGGGGSAGGSGAQNAINSGRTMTDGQPGPVGSPNNPRPTAPAIVDKAARAAGPSETNSH